MKNKLNILYEDNHIIVVEKPVNILSQSDITGDIDMLSIIKEYLKEKYKKLGNVYLGLVHRLDRPVGGIMVFAKTSKAASRLNEEIKNNEFHKEYLALVEGQVTSKKGTLVNYLYKDENWISKVVDKNYKGAKEAVLEYELLKYFSDSNTTLLKIKLITGRHHQIRLQLSNIGHPIFCDQRYSNGPKDHIYLFAYMLSFIHPTKKEKITFKLIPDWNILKEIKEDL